MVGDSFSSVVHSASKGLLTVILSPFFSSPLFSIIFQTNYVNMSYFIFLCGSSQFNLMDLKMSYNISNSTVEKLESEFEGLKALVSFILHLIVVVCIAVCIIMNNAEFCSTTLPPSIVVVILIFSFLFSIVGSILLLVHHTHVKEEQAAFTGCAIQSLAGALGVVIVAAFFIQVPPRHLIMLEGEDGRRIRRSKEDHYVGLFAFMKRKRRGNNSS
ncbi:hypothetical protein Y032_0251g181 [Ancylostoma ceylanicum]|uniref:MARVEL domain-containing protein n=1 Tax=Ancylostoma ceylanicum TaxID=53326 RepID=A0A016SD13_9BILA|nr:hypothetical protein Y032_0251g181 [Ancylostoma ceylanicum]